MLNNFNDERGGKTPPRGLSKFPHECVFEMYITEKIRENLRNQHNKASTGRSRNPTPHALHPTP